MAVYISRDEDTYLAHYGVKGMKWRKHLKAKVETNKNVGMAGLMMDKGLREAATAAIDKASSKGKTKSVREKAKSRRFTNSISTHGIGYSAVQTGAYAVLLALKRKKKAKK